MDQDQGHSKLEEPTIIVIFGVSGDLAKRKVLPALYHLLKDGLMDKNTKIIGTSRQSITANELLSDVELCVIEEDKVCDPDALQVFRQIFEVITFDPVSMDSYEKLKEKLDYYESQNSVCYNRLFYLSIPPQVFGPIVRLLGKSGLSGSCSHGNAKTRLLVEKPFGFDIVSSIGLIDETGEFFDEQQIFRIDHYLAKETAQNILTFRKFNPLFKHSWDNSLISGIKIRAVEQIGIEGRANFYDNIGALRDLIQSHLMQLLALTTMELPEDVNNAEQIHKAKLDLLNSVNPPSLEDIKSDVIRAQYEGYREEVNKLDSNTETYAKIKLFISNNRWANVPITLETGKALESKQTDITIDFGESKDSNINQLRFRIQPNEGIDIKLHVKQPSLENIIQDASMDFSYKKTFDDHSHPDAYERVLVDAIRGDQSLFASSQEVIRSWQILEPILDFWSVRSDDLKFYPPGSININ